jgi:hypothetical protein
VDLENEVAAQNNSAKAITNQQTPIIEAAQAIINKQVARVESAREQLAQEIGEHQATMEGLLSAVKAAEGVDARLNAEGL